MDQHRLDNRGLVNYTNVDVYVLNEAENQGMPINRRTTGVYYQGSYSLMGGVAVSQEIDSPPQRGAQQDRIQINASLDVVPTRRALNKLPFQVQLGFGYDLVAGDQADTTENEAFNTMYATNHKYYGVKEYFLGIPVRSRGAGSIPALTAALQTGP